MTPSAKSASTTRHNKTSKFRLSSLQHSLLEQAASSLERTCERIRFYGQRTYMEMVNLHFELHKIPLLPGEKIRIDFLCIAAYLWPVWQSVYEACLSDDRVQVRVILLDRGHSFLKDAACTDAENFLQQHNIPHIPYDDYTPDIDRPHIAMYQFPYNSIYEEFRKVSPDLVKLRGTRPVYISYGIEYDEARNTEVITGLHYHNYAQSLAWRSFVMHEDIQKGYFRNCRTGGAHVHVLGHPRFDVYAQRPTSLPKYIDEVRQGRSLLFYNIHHPSDHGCCKGTGQSHSLPIKETVASLMYLAEQADICTVVNLHPLFEAWALEKGRTTVDTLKQMKESIRHSPNAALLETGDYRAVLPHISAFISDESSLLLEMAFQNRPLLYFYDEPVSLKPFVEEITTSFYHGRGRGHALKDVKAFVRQLRCGGDPLAEKRQRIWNKYFGACDGRIGQRIAEHMLTALHTEKDTTA